MKSKLKQLLACAVAAVMLAGLFAINVTANAADEIRVILDGEELEFDVAPQIVDERTMVPMRAIFEALGATVEWDDETRTVTAVRGETTVIMQVGNYSMFVDDSEIVLDVAPLIEGERTLVPARAVAEGLDADVQWDGVARVVTITSQADDADNDDEQTEVATHFDIEAIASLRHSFEQRWLPQLIYEVEDIVALLLRVLTVIPPEESETFELLKELIRDEWFITTANAIAGYLVGLDIGYSADDMDTLTASVVAMQAEVGLGQEHIVSIEFEQIDDDTTAFIIEMLHIDVYNISTFIAIAYNEYFGLRYFTLEQIIDMFGLDPDVFMFCFVVIGPIWERGSLGATLNTREHFVEAVRYEMSVD